jgi:hypothetical protein
MLLSPPEGFKSDGRKRFLGLDDENKENIPPFSFPRGPVFSSASATGQRGANQEGRRSKKARTRF